VSSGGFLNELGTGLGAIAPLAGPLTPILGAVAGIAGAFGGGPGEPEVLNPWPNPRGPFAPLWGVPRSETGADRLSTSVKFSIAPPNRVPSNVTGLALAGVPSVVQYSQGFDTRNPREPAVISAHPFGHGVAIVTAAEMRRRGGSEMLKGLTLRIQPSLTYSTTLSGQQFAAFADPRFVVQNVGVPAGGWPATPAVTLMADLIAHANEQQALTVFPTFDGIDIQEWHEGGWLTAWHEYGGPSNPIALRDNPQAFPGVFDRWTTYHAEQLELFEDARAQWEAWRIEGVQQQQSQQVAQQVQQGVLNILQNPNDVSGAIANLIALIEQSTTLPTLGFVTQESPATAAVLETPSEVVSDIDVDASAVLSTPARTPSNAAVLIGAVAVAILLAKG
jgi:hypothetical protein